MKHRITNTRVMQPGEGIIGDSLSIDNGLISSVGSGDNDESPDIPAFDAGGCLLTPGLIDLHTHGLCEFSFESGPDQLVNGVSNAVRFGTTCLFPTLVRGLASGNLDGIGALTEALKSVEDVCLPGFHMEGPFVALAGAGVETVPGNVDHLRRLVAAAEGMVGAMSVSPDCENVVPVIEALSAEGIASFITHTKADVDQTQSAIDAGARHATHFYDVFYMPDETDPGVRPVGAVETILADRRCSVDFVCDGVHVDPMAVRCALAAKGWRKIILITDSNIGAGLEEGIHDTPWGYSVRVAPGRGARIHDTTHPYCGALAGSALTMDEGIRNLMNWLDIPDEQVWAMGTSNVAALMGLEGKGVISRGADADLALWDDSDGLRCVGTWVNGKKVF